MPIKQQPRTEGGKFRSPYPERRGEVIAMRLPASLDYLVRKEAERSGMKPNQIIPEILARHFGWHSESIGAVSKSSFPKDD